MDLYFYDHDDGIAAFFATFVSNIGSEEIHFSLIPEVNHVISRKKLERISIRENTPFFLLLDFRNDLGRSQGQLILSLDLEDKVVKKVVFSSRDGSVPTIGYAFKYAIFYVPPADDGVTVASGEEQEIIEDLSTILQTMVDRHWSLYSLYRASQDLFSQGSVLETWTISNSLTEELEESLNLLGREQ